MQPKEIIENIKQTHPNIQTLYFVGCGASSSELYPAEYFMRANAHKLRTGYFTANEFNYATPAACDDTAIVIACSLGGNTLKQLLLQNWPVKKVLLLFLLHMMQLPLSLPMVIM